MQEVISETNVGLHIVFYCGLILQDTGISQRTVVYVPNIRFHENPFMLIYSRAERHDKINRCIFAVFLCERRYFQAIEICFLRTVVR
jgi:hypothetical protein